MFCQIRRMNHASGMKLLLWFTAVCGIAVSLTSCGNSGSAEHIAGTGPFDSQGNYIEAWADNPAKWRKPSRAPENPASSSQIARNDQPPMNSNPLPQNVPAVRTSRTVPLPQVDAVTPVLVKRKPQPSSQARVVKTLEKPKVVSKPKPKPKPKPKVKPKPAPKRYVVKSGDNLSSIASRNGTSVSALQRANGIKGTIIRPGQSLTIPK